MAASRKSARKSTKKAAGKKRAGSKRASAKKRPVRKTATKRTTKRSSNAAGRTPTLKRKAQKGLRAAREGMDTVREAGERTWEVLKSTTNQVVEGFRDKLGQNPDPGSTSR